MHLRAWARRVILLLLQIYNNLFMLGFVRFEPVDGGAKLGHWGGVRVGHLRALSD